MPDTAIGSKYSEAFIIRLCNNIISTVRYFRPLPSIRPQVYRFEPNTGIVQAVADYFIAPNGLELTPDAKSVYVTDTGSHTFPNQDNLTDPGKSSSIENLIRTFLIMYAPSSYHLQI